MQAHHNVKAKNLAYEKELLELFVAGICFNCQALDLTRLWRQYCATLSPAFFATSQTSVIQKPDKTKTKLNCKSIWKQEMDV